MKYFSISIFFLVCCACSDSGNGQQVFTCVSHNLNDQISYNQLVNGFTDQLTEASVEQTDNDGALGRNKAGYFHVRFQMNMTTLTDYAVHFESNEAIEQYLENLTYSFDHQIPSGGFEFTPPDNLSDHTFTDGDIASATSFFGYSLAMSLNSLADSEWFKTTASLADARSTLASNREAIQQTLEYLRSQESLLISYDAEAPNRLFFDAIAFYGLGKYLNDENAKTTGLKFMERALVLRDETAGYFIEGGGWDSSYNGVAIKIGFELYTLLGDDVPLQLKLELAQALTCATDWQISRVLGTGEISSEGNTRVYPGGESFIGTEKEIDVAKTVKAFYYMYSLSGEASYLDQADNIIDYYN